MNKEIVQKTLFTALIISILSLIANCFFIFPLERPIIYYEYLAIPFAFTFLNNKKTRYSILTLVLLADSIISLSRFYFFDTFNYLSKIPSLFISHFSLTFWLLFFGGIIVISLFIYFTISTLNYIKTDSPSKKIYSKFLIISFLVIYCIDIISGDSFFYFKPTGNNHTNISQSILMQYYKDAKIFVKKYSAISQIEDYPDNSLTYKYFKNDSSNHEMLIIVESWGYIKDSLIKKEQTKALFDLEKIGYKVVQDSSSFSGGTSQAEARELLNKTGEAYYSIIQNHPLSVNSIVSLKSNLGYHTTALQSFSGFHSSGYWFRKILGFNDIKDLIFFKDSLLNPINYNNHYEAVNDEDVFEYGIKQSQNHQKSFTYILSINTHLPFQGTINKYILTPNELKLLPTKESLNQYIRLKEQFNKIAFLLKNHSINKVVIVGDHPAPFLNPNDREFYSNKLVPAIIISK